MFHLTQKHFRFTTLYKVYRAIFFYIYLPYAEISLKEIEDPSSLKILRDIFPGFTKQLDIVCLYNKL